MNSIAEVRPDPNIQGCILIYGTIRVWFAIDVHAIAHAQDFFPEVDIVVYHSDGTIKHRYSGQKPT